MFSGIIQAIGSITELQPFEEDLRFTVHSDSSSFFQTPIELGDSIAVNGVCLTVIAFDAQSFQVDVSKETLDCTNLSQLSLGSKVNLEHALTLSQKLNGHMVSGHVDELGSIKEIINEGRSYRFHVSYSTNIARYIAAKGSITLNGISLTINQVTSEYFDINIIPHTMNETTMQFLKAGAPVNLEVDLIARYLERLSQN